MFGMEDVRRRLAVLEKQRHEDQCYTADRMVSVLKTLEQQQRRIVHLEAARKTSSPPPDLYSALATELGLSRGEAKSVAMGVLVTGGLDSLIGRKVRVSKTGINERLRITMTAAPGVTETEKADSAERFAARLRAAANTGNALLTPGRRVRWSVPSWAIRRYASGRKGCSNPFDATWKGRVIERPEGCREFGKTGERLVWVVKDDGQVRGCYPHNLEIVR